jgi:hypothetical protein
MRGVFCPEICHKNKLVTDVLEMPGEPEYSKKRLVVVVKTCYVPSPNKIREVLDLADRQ